MPIGPTRPYEPGADPAFLLHLARGLADRLDDQRDRAALAVEVGDGQRDALAVLVEHDDDELPGPGGARHHRMAHLEQVCDVGEVLPAHDLEVRHGNPFGPATSARIGRRENASDVDAAQPLAMSAVEAGKSDSGSARHAAEEGRRRGGVGLRPRPAAIGTAGRATERGLSHGRAPSALGEEAPRRREDHAFLATEVLPHEGGVAGDGVLEPHQGGLLGGRVGRGI